MHLCVNELSAAQGNRIYRTMFESLQFGGWAKTSGRVLWLRACTKLEGSKGHRTRPVRSLFINQKRSIQVSKKH
jgi:hypothetical protein